VLLVRSLDWYFRRRITAVLYSCVWSVRKLPVHSSISSVSG